MTVLIRPIAALAALIAPIAIAVSSANAMSVDRPETMSNIVRANYDGDGYRYHHHYYHGRNVVHAPFTRVESGRRTVVDAPFVHVYDGRHGTHVVAPFVDLWR